MTSLALRHSVLHTLFISFCEGMHLKAGCFIMLLRNRPSETRTLGEPGGVTTERMKKVHHSTLETMFFAGGSASTSTVQIGALPKELSDMGVNTMGGPSGPPEWHHL